MIRKRGIYDSPFPPLFRLLRTNIMHQHEGIAQKNAGIQSVFGKPEGSDATAVDSNIIYTIKWQLESATPFFSAYQF